MAKTTDELLEEIGQIRRNWLKVQLEDAGDDEEARKRKEAFLEARQRNEDLLQEKAALVEEMSQCKERQNLHFESIKAEMAELVKLSAKEYEIERKTKGANPMVCATKLQQMCIDREAELQDLYKQMDAAEKEDQEIKDRLRELQQRAANSIPVIIQEKDAEKAAMEEAWRTERRRLLSYQTDLSKRQRQLAWHLNRGSYIKQQPVDPRTAGQFGDNGKVEIKDERLALWEDRLCRDYLEWKNRAEDYKLQKIEVAQQYERIKYDFEERIDGKGLPGSKPEMEDRIAAMKVSLARQNKVVKDLVNENAELRSLKKEMEDKIKEARRYGQQLMETQHRDALALRQEERQKALEYNKRPQPRAKPLQIMEGPITGKKRFDPK